MNVSDVAIGSDDKQPYTALLRSACSARDCNSSSACTNSACACCYCYGYGYCCCWGASGIATSAWAAAPEPAALDVLVLGAESTSMGVDFGAGALPFYRMITNVPFF